MKKQLIVRNLLKSVPLIKKDRRIVRKNVAMDNKDLINLFFQVLTIMGTMGTGFFAFYRFVSSRIENKFNEQRLEISNIKNESDFKIDRLYKRLDEKVKECVKDDMYQLELKHQKENIDSRFSTLMEFLKLKFDQLDKTIEKLVRHDEEKKENKNG